jgi:hypothetical protein
MTMMQFVLTLSAPKADNVIGMNMGIDGFHRMENQFIQQCKVEVKLSDNRIYNQHLGISSRSQ